jgi:hypothetical protein
MLIYVFKRLDKKGHGNACLCHFNAESPPRVGEYLNIYLESEKSSNNYLVELVYWKITNKEDKGLLTVECFCKEIGWSNALK